MNPIKKNPLGRGLESLIPRAPAAPQPVFPDVTAGSGKLLEIDITDICPNDLQPRRDFDADGISALAESIRSKGVMQPLVVAKASGQSDTKYMLIAGERRWRASGLAGLKSVPAVVIDYPEDTDRLELALIENTQRDDLKPLELARAYSSLMDKCGYRQEDVARIAGKSRSAVANTLRLMDLPANVVEALEAKKITEGHARVFLSLDETQCARLLNAVTGQFLSVRQTEALAKRLQKAEKDEPVQEPDPNFEALAREMESFFGAKVHMKSRGKNNKRGVIQIRYESPEELDRIILKLRKGE